MIACWFCPIEAPTYANNDDMILHLRKDHKCLKPYFCHWCSNKGFASAHARRSHEENVHGDHLSVEGVIDEDNGTDVDHSTIPGSDEDQLSGAIVDEEEIGIEEEAIENSSTAINYGVTAAHEHEAWNGRLPTPDETTSLSSDSSSSGVTGSVYEPSVRQDDSDINMSDNSEDTADDITVTQEVESDFVKDDKYLCRNLYLTSSMMVDMYDTSIEHTDEEEREAAEALMVALCEIRGSNTIAALPGVIERLARLHGRWFVINIRLNQSKSHADDDSNRSALTKVMSEIGSIAETLRVEDATEGIELDDEVSYNSYLRGVYGVDSVFQNSATSGIAAGVAVEADAMPGAELTRIVHPSASSEPEDLTVSPAALTLLRITPGVVLPETVRREDLIDFVRVCHLLTKQPGLLNQMYLTGTATQAPMHFFPDTLTPAASQIEPLAAEMIADLLYRLPGTPEGFYNQVIAMLFLNRMQGMVLHVPYATNNEPFACDCCKTAFATLGDFCSHLHTHHFLAVSDKCRCDLCARICSGNKQRAGDAMGFLVQCWQQYDENALQNCLARRSMMPAVLVPNIDGSVTIGDRNINEIFQDFALAGLWGLSTEMYGIRRPRVQ
ncbi:Asparagine-rich zinc finger protein AZF1 [Sphaceloma murrayae]|uniref:Asparagine-rich zinc finger protein AZF1 n=1 Tax=Sphaceloma murrayae TaxID=2082308 RepID=A0A2K1QW35_9PEZI|nr:Asparagine-rich zinc finger protein AZF1 [Sphaceloma murrayae]